MSDKPTPTANPGSDQTAIDVDTAKASTAHIMIVEDDPSLAEWIMDYLSSHGFFVTLANRGDEAVALIRLDEPDLVVLDVMLPQLNGFEVCRQAREFYRKPIIMLTARQDESDEVHGLDTGADDYLGKPVRPQILLARINALLRRQSDPATSSILKIGSLSINRDTRVVMLEDETLAVSSHEFELLTLLAENAGTIMSREALIAKMRGIDYDGFDRSIDISISRIRKKLEKDPTEPNRIKTVRGKGYLLVKDT